MIKKKENNKKKKTKGELSQIQVNSKTRMWYGVVVWLCGVVCVRCDVLGRGGVPDSGVCGRKQVAAAFGGDGYKCLVDVLIQPDPEKKTRKVPISSRYIVTCLSPKQLFISYYHFSFVYIFFSFTVLYEKKRNNQMSIY